MTNKHPNHRGQEWDSPYGRRVWFAVLVTGLLLIGWAVRDLSVGNTNRGYRNLAIGIFVEAAVMWRARTVFPAKDS